MALTWKTLYVLYINKLCWKHHAEYWRLCFSTVQSVWVRNMADIHEIPAVGVMSESEVSCRLNMLLYNALLHTILYISCIQKCWDNTCTAQCMSPIPPLRYFTEKRKEKKKRGVFVIRCFKAILFSLILQCGPGSSVGIATAYGLDGLGIESWWGRDFPHLSRPALRPTQPHVEWVLGFSQG
jgi:hypothetical protein